MADVSLRDVSVGVMATARDTLGGAVTVAEGLSGEVGAQMVAVARAAFTQGLELIAAVSAAIAMVLAVVALLLLRRVGAGSETESQPEPEHEATIHDVDECSQGVACPAATLSVEPCTQ